MEGRWKEKENKRVRGWGLKKRKRERDWVLFMKKRNVKSIPSTSVALEPM